MPSHGTRDRRRHKSRSRKRRRSEPSPRPPPSPPPSAPVASSAPTHTPDDPGADGSNTVTHVASLQDPVTVALCRGGEAALTAAELVRCVAVAGVLVATARVSSGH